MQSLGLPSFGGGTMVPLKSTNSSETNRIQKWLYIVIDQNTRVPVICIILFVGLFELPNLVLASPVTPERNWGARGGVTVVAQVKIEAGPVGLAVDAAVRL